MATIHLFYFITDTKTEYHAAQYHYNLGKRRGNIVVWLTQTYRQTDINYTQHT